MNFRIIPTEKFMKDAKRLSKKYPSLKEDLRKLEVMLGSDPKSGTDLGSNLYKVRMAVKSKGKGKVVVRG